MSIDLSGQTIIITGASSGIGAATAHACAAAGPGGEQPQSPPRPRREE